MTIARFNALLDTYEAARKHTRWVMKNLDAPAINTAETAKAAYLAAQDQEMMTLKELCNAARELKV